MFTIIKLKILYKAQNLLRVQTPRLRLQEGTNTKVFKYQYLIVGVTVSITKY